jgi:hypothetical protein
MRKVVRTVIAGGVLMAALPAQADVLPFTGSVTGLSSFLGAEPPCGGSQPFHSAIDPLSSVGTSALGKFTYSTDTCLSAGGVTSSGTFIIDFGTDLFNGIFDGGSTPTGTPGISDTAWLFTVLGGTGRFAGASGTFEGTGVSDSRTPPTHVSIDFTGSIDAPAVPEPASWALMILGFGASAWPCGGDASACSNRWPNSVAGGLGSCLSRVPSPRRFATTLPRQGGRAKAGHGSKSRDPVSRSFALSSAQAHDC